MKLLKCPNMCNNRITLPQNKKKTIALQPPGVQCVSRALGTFNFPTTPQPVCSAMCVANRTTTVRCTNGLYPEWALTHATRRFGNVSANVRRPSLTTTNGIRVSIHNDKRLATLVLDLYSVDDGCNQCPSITLQYHAAGVVTNGVATKNMNHVR